MTAPDEVLANAVESAVIGPDDVLVLLFEQMNSAEFERIKSLLDQHSNGLAGRVLIIAGAKAMVARGAAKAVAR